MERRRSGKCTSLKLPPPYLFVGVDRTGGWNTVHTFLFLRCNLTPTQNETRPKMTSRLIFSIKKFLIRSERCKIKLWYIHKLEFPHPPWSIQYRHKYVLTVAWPQLNSTRIIITNIDPGWDWCNKREDLVCSGCGRLNFQTIHLLDELLSSWVLIHY